MKIKQKAAHKGWLSHVLRFVGRHHSLGPAAFLLGWHRHAALGSVSTDIPRPPLKFHVAPGSTGPRGGGGKASEETHWEWASSSVAMRMVSASHAKWKPSGPRLPRFPGNVGGWGQQTLPKVKVVTARFWGQVGRATVEAAASFFLRFPPSGGRSESCPLNALEEETFTWVWLGRWYWWIIFLAKLFPCKIFLAFNF